jgi:hypothetical protein
MRKSRVDASKAKRSRIDKSSATRIVLIDIFVAFSAAQIANEPNAHRASFAFAKKRNVARCSTNFTAISVVSDALASAD